MNRCAGHDSRGPRGLAGPSIACSPKADRGRVGGLFVLMLICTAGAGCSRKTYWYHPDRTLAEAERDCRECYQQAEAQAARAGWGQSLDGGQTESESPDQQWLYAHLDAQFRRCMRRLGYHLASDRELKAPVRKRVLQMSAIQALPIAGK